MQKTSVKAFLALFRQHRYDKSIYVEECFNLTWAAHHDNLANSTSTARI